MTTPDTLRNTRIRLNHGSVLMPAVGFGTLIPDPLATKQATRTALEVAFRHFDCAERYRNEEAVGEAMQEVFKGGVCSARGRVRYHETMEHQSSSGPGRTCFRGQSSAAESRPHIDCYIETPAQVVLAWAVQRGTAFLTTSTKSQRIQENFEISALPEDAMREIRDRITTSVRFNAVVETGVPGFIPRAPVN